MFDEEGLQCKAFRFLFGKCRLRGDTEPEAAHPLFNALKRAWRAVLPNMRDYNTSVLKLCICCNYSHGSYLSGGNHAKKQELFLEFLEAQPLSWFQQFSEDLAVGRGHFADEDQTFPVSVISRMSEPVLFRLTSPCRKRLRCASERSWTQMLFEIEESLHLGRSQMHNPISSRH